MGDNTSYQQQFGRHTINTKGNPRARFELFVRWPENAGRKMNPFLYRGDRFDITDPEKMLQSLLRLFEKDYKNWTHAELYDNTIPCSEKDRIVLSLKKGRIEHRLKDYELMLNQFALPDYLK